MLLAIIRAGRKTGKSLLSSAGIPPPFSPTSRGVDLKQTLQEREMNDPKLLYVFSLGGAEENKDPGEKGGFKESSL